MRYGVILMAHGTPNSLDEVEPYLNIVMKRRKPAPEIVHEIRERYRLIGGKSPLTEITQAQAKALASKLALNSSKGLNEIPVFVAMRNWHPFIEEVVPEIAKKCVTNLVAISMTPFYSKITVGAYLDDLETSVKKHSPSMKIIPVKNWQREPKLIEAWKERISEKLSKDECLLFTAHSIPQSVIDQGDPYAEQVQETVSEIVKHFPGVRYDFAYQSASSSAEKWLGPNVDTKLGELVRNRVKKVLVVPVGFICDHIEVVYDIDILHYATAKKLGIEYRRTDSLNTHYLLIGTLFNITSNCLKNDSTTV